MNKRICWLHEIDREDRDWAGGKVAFLGELARMEAPVLPGFVIWQRLAGGRRNVISKTLGREIVNFYHELPYYHYIYNDSEKTRRGKRLKRVWSWGKRGLTKGFKQETVRLWSDCGHRGLDRGSLGPREFEIIKGEANLVEAVKKILVKQKLGGEKIGFSKRGSVVAQKSVKAETFGKMTTISPVSKDRNKIVIEVLGRSGSVSEIPEVFVVDRRTLKLIEKSKGASSLSLKQIVKLAILGRRIEKHFYFPQEIKWLIGGGEVWIEETEGMSMAPLLSKSN